MAFSGVGCVCGVCDGKEKKGVQVPESPYGGGGRVCIMGVGCPRDVYKTHKTKHDYMSQARTFWCFLGVGIAIIAIVMNESHVCYFCSLLYRDFFMWSWFFLYLFSAWVLRVSVSEVCFTTIESVHIAFSYFLPGLGCPGSFCFFENGRGRGTGLYYLWCWVMMMIVINVSGRKPRTSWEV